MIITALFVLMILLVSIQVLNRYGTGLSIPWTEEAARTAYVVLIFVGSALAVLRGNHIAVFSVVKLLPARAQSVLAAFAAVLSAIFFCFVAYGNYVYTVVNWDAVFPTMPYLTIGYVIAVVMASSVLTVVLFLCKALRLLTPGATEEQGPS